MQRIELPLGLRKYMRSWCWIDETAAVLLLCFAPVTAGFCTESLRQIVPNQNHIPAGVLRDGVLTIQLEIAKGEWHPEADDGVALSVYAFGELGRPLQNPGPLIRVPQGTEIRATLHNTLAEPITVHGLGDTAGIERAVHIAPGSFEHVRFRATTPGLFFYWGASKVDDLKLRYGIDSELTGVFVVDPPGASANDEIFVIEMMSEHPGLNARETLATVNGKSWPYTQRFQYDVGQPIRWRWVNATNEPHALHLHGPAGPTTAASAAWHADRKLQLEISERRGAPRYALQLHGDTQASDTPKGPGLIGPPIVLTRGQPVEIEVVNRLKDPTAIHWHGIELESYYDGVPGWSGLGTQITPPIAPGTSFVARMAPPRAGTFIYHTHWHHPSQLTNGIYGPLIVLPPGEKFDPTSDLTFVFSIGDFGALQELALINGTPQSKTLQLEAGKKYRFRLINISTNNQGMQVSLGNTSGPVEWLNVAKDGVDLPAELVHQTKAQLTITVGETYDVEFSTVTPQDLLLDLLLPGQKIHTTQTLAFVCASSGVQ